MEDQLHNQNLQGRRFSAFTVVLHHTFNENVFLLGTLQSKFTSFSLTSIYFVSSTEPFVFMWHLPTLIQCVGNLTPEVSSVKAEAVINGPTPQQSPLAAHVSLASKLQLNLWAPICCQGSEVNYSLKYGRLLSLLQPWQTKQSEGGRLQDARP